MFSIFSSNLLSIKDCAQPNLTMDGYCHDETNIPECNFDWGDCCGECVNIEFCTNCTCIGNSIGKKVPNPAIGNGICNDYLNNKMCDFDHGDCCLSNVITEKCSDCTCHHSETCKAGHHPLAGDGTCHKVLNTTDCKYDGYDCHCDMMCVLYLVLG